jgi:cellulose biosynthesis protein BcsQ
LAKRDKSLPRIFGQSRAASTRAPDAERSSAAAPAPSAERTAAIGGTITATIAVYSVKGGVGKTTTAANLAWCSAAVGHRTLLWDLDAAAGAGFLLGIDPERRLAAGDVFTRERDAGDLIRPTEFERLEVLPADESIRTLDRSFSALGKRRRLAKLTEELGARFDRIVLDCPPVLNEISAQVLRAADCVIVPLPPSPLSARAFELVTRAIEEHAKDHPPIVPVLSMLDRRRTLHRDAAAEHKGWPVIPHASAVEQCAVRRAPVGAFAPRSPAAEGFAALWQAIERKLAKNKG